MAQGNTFAATAFGSYGGFWMSLGIILTPGGFHIIESYPTPEMFGHAFSFFIFVGLPALPFEDPTTDSIIRAGLSSRSY